MVNTDQLVQRLLVAGIATPDQIQGCSDSDLQTIARGAPGPLPQGYLDFLRAIGRGAGRFLAEQDVFYPRLLDLNEQAKEVLDNWEEGQLQLPADAFVCSMRYGDQFLFFHADGKADNPQLHHYYLEQGRFRPVGTFWGWIEEELRLAERVSNLH